MQDHIEALSLLGVPIPIRMLDAVTGKNTYNFTVSGDKRESSPGKEIITGDTVEGDDKPQTPDEKK